ncbi:MAG TPA: ornithine cyclodeaminase family protein [Gemmatimonadaceae bacterium]|nr:ornithine cyclodeaminase family protein [Gemmatimonadaceae bacterium]
MSEHAGGTLVLTRSDVRRFLGIDDCIAAVEHAFVLYAEGRVPAPGVLGAHVEDGGFHIKTAVLPLERPYFAAKVNANYPANRERFALPTIQGVIALFDVRCGRPLAVLDSAEITSLRTAAATAVAAKHLARADASVATVCGCGEQGRSQLRALARVRRLRLVLAVDADPARATAYADEMSRELEIEVRAASDLTQAVAQSDLCVTCTTSRRAILHRGEVPPGAFVAAVGADNPEKQEIDPALLAESTVVVDVLDQCAAIGDLHHAIEAGVMTRADVYAELGEVAAGRKRGRRREDEVIVFDSTGTALQDVAAAAVVYERALAAGGARQVELPA